jgi:Family of unknown function (DUF6163)
MSETSGDGFGDQNPRLPLTILYMRAIAVLLLIVGLARAGRILGMLPDGITFADLTPPRRVGTATLLLVDLLAAVGLWLGAAWGPVIWAVALAVEVSMYTVFGSVFGTAPLRVIVHSLLFAGFLAITILEWQRSLED